MGYGSLDYSSEDRNSDSYSHSLPRHVHKKSHRPIPSFKKGKLHHSRSYSMDNAAELLPHVPEIPTTIRNEESNSTKSVPIAIPALASISGSVSGSVSASISAFVSVQSEDEQHLIVEKAEEKSAFKKRSHQR
jgi:hypothetical protein